MYLYGNVFSGTSTGVLEEGDDELMNVNIHDMERVQKNLENKKSKPAYNPYDMEEDELGMVITFIYLLLLQTLAVIPWWKNAYPISGFLDFVLTNFMTSFCGMFNPAERFTINISKIRKLSCFVE